MPSHLQGKNFALQHCSSVFLYLSSLCLQAPSYLCRNCQGRLSLIKQHTGRFLLNGDIILSECRGNVAWRRKPERAVLGETETPGVLGKALGSRRSQGSGAMAFSVILWHWGEMFSFTALFVLLGFGFFFFPQTDKRNLVLETEKIPFFSSHLPIGLTYIQPDLYIGVLSIIPIVF